MTEYIIGPYLLTHTIGKGGMANVYRAVHRLMEREVALKLILSSLLTEEQAQARFLREVKLLAKLEHSCIVPIYDSGVIENSGQLYLAMRLMKGGSLEERLKGQGKLSIAEYLPILRRVVDGLGFAHRHNIVHRDLKPGNILFDADGLAYLSDFGIAHVAQQTQQMTDTGAKIGTPQYMAPEQFEGQAVDGRTDQYALAVMSYQVLSGRRPFEADTLVTLMKMHLMDTPPTLTLPDKALGKRINAVLQKALAKEPTQRYATCADFLQALESACQRKQGVSEPTLLEVTYIESKPSSLHYPSVAIKPASVLDHNPTKARSTVRKRTQVFLLGCFVVSVFITCMIGFILTSTSIGKANVGATQTALQIKATENIIATQSALLLIPSSTIVTLTIVPTQILTIGSTKTREVDGMVMMYVPAGEFLMGSNDGPDNEFPAHTVYLDGYWIDQTEVTNAQYFQCALAGVCDRINYDRHYSSSLTESDFNGDLQPVSLASQSDAKNYCKWVGAQLPSEAQWEKAARGTDGRIYTWGNTEPNNNLVNYVTAQA